MDDFENAFGSAFNDSGTNKVVEDSQKQEEPALEKEQPDSQGIPEPVASSSTESNTDAQPIRRRGRKRKTVAIATVVLQLKSDTSLASAIPN